MTAPRVRDGVAEAWVFPGNYASLRHLPLTSQVSAHAQTRMVTREATQVPSLHGRHILRPRLTCLLDSCTAQSVIVIAPAGYGKTSLAAEWLSGRHDVAWVRATSGSADVAAFSIALVEAIAPLVPGAGDRLRQRLRVAEPPETAARPLAELLAEDLAHWPDGARLVLDDYHHVAESAPVEDFMDWLLMLAPRLRALVTTRKRPKWATARRILYGEVAEVTKEQLAMTDDEAAEVLAGRPTESARALIAQAQGWPVLIGLASLVMTEEIPTERVSDELFRYFAEEVLRQQPEPTQQFMLRAAMPKTLTATVAEAALGLADVEVAIATLAAEGLLQEAAPSVWSFHPLLQDFLRRRLESEQPKAAADLVDGVIAHARGVGDWEQAFDLALSRGRVETAAEILGEAAPALLSGGQIEIVEKWLEACASVVRCRPDALLARADVALWRGRLNEAASVGLSAADLPGADDSLRSRAWCLSARALHLLSRDGDSLLLCKRALEKAATNAEATECLWVGLLAATDLEIEEAQEFLAHYQDRAPADVDTRLRVQSALMIQAMRSGRATDGEGADLLLPLVDYARDPLVQTNFLSGLSYVQCVQARYSDAQRTIAQAVRIAREMRLEWVEAACLVPTGYADVGLRRFQHANLLVNRLARGAVRFGDAFLGFSARTLALRLDLAQGSTGTQRTPMPAADLGQLPNFAQGELLALRALGCAAERDLDASQRLASEAQELTRTAEALFTSRFAQLIAKIQRQSPLLHENAATLFQDVITAETFDCFVLAYRAFPPLLELAHELLPSENRLLDAVGRANDGALALRHGLRVPPAVERESPIRGLTSRESEVLALLDQGLTNSEIAGRLVIELSTVKSHVHCILQKLGVSNRLQAVLLSRERVVEE